MPQVNPLQNREFQRQNKNSTKLQKKIHSANLEGTIVNNMIKDDEYLLKDSRNSMLIPIRSPELPKELQVKKRKDDFARQALVPFTLGTIALLGGLAGVTKIIQHAAVQKTKLPSWRALPEIPRNIALNEETHFATYVALQNPNRKTIIGALGVFVLSAAGLIGKNFVDGFKDIWVKKQEAGIQRNLQENLIEV